MTLTNWPMRPAAFCQSIALSVSPSCFPWASIAAMVSLIFVGSLTMTAALSTTPCSTSPAGKTRLRASSRWSFPPSDSPRSCVTAETPGVVVASIFRGALAAGAASGASALPNSSASAFSRLTSRAPDSFCSAWISASFSPLMNP